MTNRVSMMAKKLPAATDEPNNVWAEMLEASRIRAKRGMPEAPMIDNPTTRIFSVLIRYAAIMLMPVQIMKLPMNRSSAPETGSGMAVSNAMGFGMNVRIRMKKARNGEDFDGTRLMARQ